jgi:hypothetical protein
VFPGGAKNLKGRLVFAFEAKERAGSGQRGVPAYLEVLALQAVGGFCGEILLASVFIAHILI